MVLQIRPKIGVVTADLTVLPDWFILKATESEEVKKEVVKMQQFPISCQHVE